MSIRAKANQTKYRNVDRFIGSKDAGVVNSELNAIYILSSTSSP